MVVLVVILVILVVILVVVVVTGEKQSQLLVPRLGLEFDNMLFLAKLPSSLLFYSIS